MIYKNCEYGKTECFTIAEFGEGTIHMFCGSIKNKSHLLFVSGKKIPIGDIDLKKEYKGKLTSDNLEPGIVFTFTNPESIDQIILMLKDAKEKLMQKPKKS